MTAAGRASRATISAPAALLRRPPPRLRQLQGLPLRAIQLLPLARPREPHLRLALLLTPNSPSGDAGSESSRPTPVPNVARSAQRYCCPWPTRRSLLCWIPRLTARLSTVRWTEAMHTLQGAKGYRVRLRGPGATIERKPSTRDRQPAPAPALQRADICCTRAARAVGRRFIASTRRTAHRGHLGLA